MYDICLVLKSCVYDFFIMSDLIRSFRTLTLCRKLCIKSDTMKKMANFLQSLMAHFI